MIQAIARRQRRPNSQQGFTLIELLVVIIILGILAAVVVFAVGGVGDKGRSAALSTDYDTIQTAQEAYCANNGTYASEATLVTSGLLSEQSSMHDIELGTGGNCGNTSYTITSTAGNGWAGAALPFAQQSLKVAYRGDPWTTDMRRLARFPLDTNVNETLTKVRNDYQVDPRLATSWSLINPGNNPAYPSSPTWRFKLRPGVIFHNETPFTATDVKYSMDRLVNLGDDFTAKLGASSSVVVDPLTIDITTITPNLRLPEILVHPTYAIIANNTGIGVPGNNLGTPSTANIVGTGPFKFRTFAATSNIVVERYDGYWGQKSKLKDLTFRFINDATARRLALEAGDVDAMYDVGRQQVGPLRSNSAINVVSAPTSFVFNLYMNLNGTASAFNETTDPVVRQALALSIDRQDFVNKNWESGVATLANTPSPIFVLGPHASQIQGYSPNLAMANQILDAAGWTCGGGAPGSNTPCAGGPANPTEVRIKAGEPLDLFMLSQASNADDPLLQDLKGRVLKAGIQMTIDSGATSSQRSTKKNQGNWDLDHVNPNQNDSNPAFLLTLQWWSLSVNPWVSCLAATPPNCGPWQQAGPAFDNLVAQALAAPNLDGAQNFSAQAMKQIGEQEHKIIPLAALSRVYGLRKHVGGFTSPHPAESHLLWDKVFRSGG